MNEVALATGSAVTRDINIVTAEIKDLCSEARTVLGRYCVEIGRRVYEAKSLVPHGEWGSYVKNELGFSQRTAENYIKVFEGYSDEQITVFGAEIKSQALANLGMTKLISLLAIPEPEREEFAKEADAENISTRELDRLIKERNEAIARAERAERDAAEKDECISGLKTGADELLRQLRDKDSEIEAAKLEASEYEDKAEKANAAKDKINKKLSEYKQSADDAKREAESAAAREADLRNQARTLHQDMDKLREENEKLRQEAEHGGNDDIIRLNVLFETVQSNISDMLDIFDRVAEAESYKDIVRETIIGMFNDSEVQA